MTVMNSSTFVGIYGSLTIHDWLDAVTLEEDAYSLFHSRAVSLGWATSSAGDPGSEHWGMNGAGLDWESDGTSAPLAWFQVCLPESTAKGCAAKGCAAKGCATKGYALPVPALPACAEDSIERVGQMRLDAVQALVQTWRHPGDPSRLASGLNPSIWPPPRTELRSG